jgi:RND family efflux transporter MFP subunit
VPRRLRLVGLLAVVAVIAIVAAGISIRTADQRRLVTWTQAQTVPSVNVVLPAQSANGLTLDLPGRLQAYSRAPIFARVSGYLKSWKVDIGAHVKAGQLLAEIETPDLDQQLLQAKANLASAQASAALAGSTARRWQAMAESDSVSKQDVDERTGDYTAKQAMVQAAQANVNRIDAMKAFTRIVAPFDGLVTARETDVGALINAGSGSGPELFVVSDVRKLRVYVHVPQNYVPLIQPGTQVALTVPEYPGQRFTARVEASAGAVDIASGSTLVQLSVDNTAGRLMPGGFADLRFDLPADHTAFRVPANTLVFDEKGMRVATVAANNQVVFKKVTIAQDFGNSVAIGSGLAATDRVIESPPDGLLDGDQVQVARNGGANGDGAGNGASGARRAGKSGDGQAAPHA